MDADVDVHNTSEVLFHLTANTDPQRDSLFTKGPSDVLDHAASKIAPPREIRHGTGEQGKSRQDYLTGQGSKLGLDATKKLTSLPREIERPVEPSANRDMIISRGEVSHAPGRRSSRWMKVCGTKQPHCLEMPVTKFEELLNLPVLA